MIRFVRAQHRPTDWRLYRHDGQETEVAGPNSQVAGWDSQPDFETCLTALLDYHGIGDSPFSTRAGTIDALTLAQQWPVPVRDLQLTDETLPWEDG